MKDLDYTTLKEDLLNDNFFNTILTEEEIECFINNLKGEM